MPGSVSASVGSSRASSRPALAPTTRWESLLRTRAAGTGTTVARRAPLPAVSRVGGERPIACQERSGRRIGERSFSRIAAARRLGRRGPLENRLAPTRQAQDFAQESALAGYFGSTGSAASPGRGCRLWLRAPATLARCSCDAQRGCSTARRARRGAGQRRCPEERAGRGWRRPASIGRGKLFVMDVEIRIDAVLCASDGRWLA